jgi:hypothetical protein
MAQVTVSRFSEPRGNNPPVNWPKPSGILEARPLAMRLLSPTLWFVGNKQSIDLGWDVSELLAGTFGLPLGPIVPLISSPPDPVDVPRTSLHHRGDWW